MMSTPEMIAAVQRLRRLAYVPHEAEDMVPDEGDLCVRTNDPGLSLGLFHLRSEEMGVDFMVLKTFRKKGLFGGSKPNYTLIVGYDQGESWEEGPSVARATEITKILRAICNAHGAVSARFADP